MTTIPPGYEIETAVCSLCAKQESSGFFTGCMIQDIPAELGINHNGWFCDGQGNLTRPKGITKYHQALLVRGDRAVYIQYSLRQDINYTTVEGWVEEQLGMRLSGTPWSWLDFSDVSPASVRYRWWLEGSQGAGFELLKSQSVMDDQIAKTKSWLRANRDVVHIKVLTCTIHPQCLTYLPPLNQPST